MKFRTLTAVLFMGMAMIGSSAKASVWTNGITYNNVQDNLTSTGSAYFVDQDSNGTFGVNDYLVGIVKWTNNNPGSLTFGNYAVSVYAGKVSSTYSPGDNSTLTFPTIGFNLTPDSTYLQGLLGISQTLNSNTFGLTMSGSSDPFSSTASAGLSLLGSSFAIDFEFGTNGLNDKFVTEFRDPGNSGSIDITNSGGKVGEYSSFGNSFVIGYLGADFTILKDYTTGYTYNQVSDTAWNGSTVSGDFIFSYASQFTNTAGSGWNMQSDFTGLINPSNVPEPSAILIWGGAMVFAGGLAIRRRKNRVT